MSSFFLIKPNRPFPFKNLIKSLLQNIYFTKHLAHIVVYENKMINTLLSMLELKETSDYFSDSFCLDCIAQDLQFRSERPIVRERGQCEHGY